ncbi:MAG TPA: hypothetical protein VMN79_17910 [Casimicrobiaceae bacterium]|nr:hypothetical protein [Casimicrobiaceae bacterium]
MKRLMTAAALAGFAMLPLAASACDAYDETMATTTPPAALASTQPAASKLPAATIAKASVPKSTKQTVARPDAKASTTKVAAAPGN